MQQAAAMAWVRVVIGNLDLFGFNPVLNAIYDYEMQFNPDETIKGDFVTVAKGVQGAMSREVLAARLNTFMNIFQSPQLKHLPDWEKAGYLLEKTAGLQGLGLILPYREAMRRKLEEEEAMAKIGAAPNRIQPVIPPPNAALEILSKVPETSPAYGPALEGAARANNMMTPALAAAINVINEISAANAVRLISGEDQQALSQDVQAPPMPPLPHPDEQMPMGGPQMAPMMGQE